MNWHEANRIDMEFTWLLNDGFSDFCLFARARQWRWEEKRGMCLPLPDMDCYRPLYEWRFTNAYRILDRMSQTIIDIVNHPISAEEHAMQIYLARLFNRPETWAALAPRLPLNSPEKVLEAVSEVAQEVQPLFNAAYMLAPPWTFGFASWTDLYVARLFELLESGDLMRLYYSDELALSFEILNKYPGFGDFLSYQLALDYSYLHNVDYEAFIVPGPGAQLGFKICYPNTHPKMIPAVIKHLTREGITSFNKLKVDGNYYPLRGNDIQNLFCEYGKYRKILDGKFGKRKYTERMDTSPVLIPNAWSRP